jgi:hypothetical protein
MTNLHANISSCFRWHALMDIRVAENWLQVNRPSPAVGLGHQTGAGAGVVFLTRHPWQHSTSHLFHGTTNRMALAVTIIGCTSLWLRGLRQQERCAVISVLSLQLRTLCRGFSPISPAANTMQWFQSCLSSCEHYVVVSVLSLQLRTLCTGFSPISPVVKEVQ